MPWDVEGDPVKPQAAIDWFRARLPITDAQFDTLTDRARRRAFTLGSGVTLETVQGVFDSIAKALEDGTPFEAWRKDLPDALNAQWGAKGHRMRTVFDTAVQSAYGAGRWQAADELRVERPVWGLEVVLDSRTSDICQALAGTVLPAHDPFWKTHVPPLHFKCRTALVTYSSAQAKARGITPKAPGVPAQRGFGLEPTVNEWSPKQEDYDPLLWAAHQTVQRRAKPPATADFEAQYARFGDAARKLAWGHAALERGLDAPISEVVSSATQIPSLEFLVKRAQTHARGKAPSLRTVIANLERNPDDNAVEIAELRALAAIHGHTSQVTGERLDVETKTTLHPLPIVPTRTPR
ncbi:MAG: minor capsid protein [Pleurocapsa sp. SU_196_0]|nr:minor capsid protein [Pleurocapsa sp. SU_196_0]